jgi:hypothetical protein
LPSSCWIVGLLDCGVVRLWCCQIVSAQRETSAASSAGTRSVRATIQRTLAARHTAQDPVAHLQRCCHSTSAWIVSWTLLGNLSSALSALWGPSITTRWHTARPVTMQSCCAAAYCAGSALDTLSLVSEWAIEAYALDVFNTCTRTHPSSFRNPRSDAFGECLSQRDTQRTAPT